MNEKTVIFPTSSLESIGKGAFAYNSGLTEVILPDGLAALGSMAFYSSPNINKVYIPGSIQNVPDFAFTFGDASAVVEIGEGCASLDAYSLDLILGNCVIRRLLLPSTITDIHPLAFGDCGINIELVYTTSTAAKTFFENHSILCVDKPCLLNENLISMDNASYLYTGSEIRPKVTCQYENNESNFSLIENEDYIVSYENNVNLGKASVKVTGIGAFTGTVVKEFQIYNTINRCNITLEYESVLYDGKEKTPSVKVTYKTTTLTEDTDYTISYANNTESGTATVKISGKGSYSGTVEKTFSIYKKDLSEALVSLEYESVLYDGKEKTPSVKVTYETTTLTEDADYTISYANNTESGTATVKISGKGSYSGTVEKTFSIYKKDLSEALVSLEYESVLYDGKEKTPSINVKYKGDLLTEDKDYTVEFTNNVLPGTAKIYVKGIGQCSGIIEKEFAITALSIENAEVVLKESIYSYDGSPKKPSVTVKLGNNILVNGTDYSLTYEDNVNDGIAYVVVTGIGIYTDVVKTSFVILPYNAGMDSVYPNGTMIDGSFVYGITDDDAREVELCCPATRSLEKAQIPATITDEAGVEYKVTSIGQKAFYKNTKIKTLVIGNNIKSIENYAFYGCKNISSIQFGKSVENIGSSSFRKCTKLVFITLPKSIDELGKNAFYGCSKLKHITINASSVIDVNTNAIKGISKKAVIKVPSKLVKKYEKKFEKQTGFEPSMKIKKK